MGKRYLAVGGDIITTKANQEIIDEEIYRKCSSSSNVVFTCVSFKNTGLDTIHFIVNDGDIMPLGGGEAFSCGDFDIFSLIIVESGSSIRWSGFSCVGKINK